MNLMMHYYNVMKSSSLHSLTLPQTTQYLICSCLSSLTISTLLYCFSVNL